jgi:hypothetical protein
MAAAPQITSFKWVSCADHGALQVHDVHNVFRPVSNKAVNLVSIFGRARQGKSFLMNCLAGERDVFRISNEKESCTQGIDISNKWMTLEDFSRVDAGQRIPNHPGLPFVGFMDAEGQGDKDITYDARLICPALLASKCVIFNWKGDLQKDHILSTLGIMTRAAKNVRNDTTAANGSSAAANKPFGHLHIVFRDWQAVDCDASSTYASLFTKENTSDSSTRDAIREALLEAFSSVRVWLFDAPTDRVSDLKKRLSIDMCSVTFRQQLRAFRHVLGQQLAESTKFAGRDLSGKLMQSLVGNIVETLNR